MSGEKRWLAAHSSLVDAFHEEPSATQVKGSPVAVQAALGQNLPEVERGRSSWYALVPLDRGFDEPGAVALLVRAYWRFLRSSRHREVIGAGRVPIDAAHESLTSLGPGSRGLQGRPRRFGSVTECGAWNRAAAGHVPLDSP